MTDDRKTLGQMHAEANGEPCPGCGHGMTSNGTRTLPSGAKRQYYVCGNAECNRSFLYRQPPRELVREVKRHEKKSNDGKATLQVHRETA